MGWQAKLKTARQIYNELGLEEKGSVQKYIDKRVVENLQPYVSFKSGAQEKSIVLGSVLGSGRVIINVPYAQFQAGGKVMIGTESHRPWAKYGEKKVVTAKNLKYHGGGKRGAHPFERMKADKKNSILDEVTEYARRLAK